MITQFGKSIEPLKDSIQTFSNGPKDRFFKSFTTLIPDENGKIIGSVCVNLDVSQLLIAQNALQAFIQHPATDIHTPPATDMDDPGDEKRGRYPPVLYEPGRSPGGQAHVPDE